MMEKSFLMDLTAKSSPTTEESKPQLKFFWNKRNYFSETPVKHFIDLCHSWSA